MGKQAVSNGQHRKKNWAVCLALWLALIGTVLTGCTPDAGFVQPDPGGQSGGTSSQPKPVEDEDYQRTPPPLVLAEFTGTNMESQSDGSRRVEIDLSNVNKGYVGVRLTAPMEARLSIEKDDVKMYVYLANDGSEQFFPLTLGDGSYLFKVLTFSRIDEIQGPMYNTFLSATADVQLESEQAPFLVNTFDVNYSADSNLVDFSYELTQHATSDLLVAQMICYWVAENVTYDYEKAERVTAEDAAYYIPDPDSTLASQTGICYDYAALTAAMLRANGIPTQLVIGNVPSRDQIVRHAWNMVWLEETGYLMIGISVNPNDWTRIDLTFMAAGASSFVGDGTNYTPLYIH